MQRFLHVLPHASTGGSVAFARERIKAILNEYEVKVVEYSNLSDAYVVHKNQIINLVGKENFITLKEDKFKLLSIISDFKPDIIQLEEFPEFFMDPTLARQLYNPLRNYKIIETTHDSSFSPSNKIFFPDKIICVCPFSQIHHASLNIPMEVIEYPIDVKKPIIADKIDKKIKLGFHRNDKLVLVPGLFTQRKNQKEAFELARRLVNYPIKFIFAGNLAENFADYWKPLLEHKPSNCEILGERDDMEDLMIAADLCLFCSKGNLGNVELSPLVIRESLARELPILLYNLPVYLGRFRDESLVSFLSGDIMIDSQKILNLLNITSIDGPKQTILDSYIDIKFNKYENKISLYSTYSQKLDFAYCSVKEIMSEVPIYYWKNVVMWPGGETWTNPLSGYSFDQDEFCGGFLLEFYDSNKQVVFTKSIKIKDNPKLNPKLQYIPPFDCSYINYREFFCTDIYQGLDLNDLEMVVDVGANVGLFSQYILSKGAREVIAIEPVKKAFDSLEILSNLDSRLIPLNLAMDEKSGETDLYFLEENTTVSRLTRNTKEGNHNYDFNQIKVKTVSWNDFIKQAGLSDISLLKMDIEGQEYAVFKDITLENLSHIDKIILEFHFNYNRELDPIVSKLKSAGFILECRKQSFLEPAKLTDTNGIILAYRK